MKKYRKIAKKSEVPPGTGKSIRKGKMRLALFNVGGKFYAIQDACPHRGAPLGEGPLRGSVVTCTWHGWEFNLKKIRTYPTKTDRFHVYVSL